MLLRSIDDATNCSALTIAAVMLGVVGVHPGAVAQEASGGDAPPAFFAGAQATFILQRIAPFHSPYSGPNSLIPTGDRQMSQSYGLYFAQGVAPFAQVFADIEMVRGAGIGRVVGLAGPTNGDVIRQGSADLGTNPYLARAFIRFIVPLAGGGMDTVGRAQDQFASLLPSDRVEIIVGRLALSDLFDLNRYANSTRFQFMDWGLFNNTAWDFAADTRGYSNGVAALWLHPTWGLRAGVFQMPFYANGNVFDSDLSDAHGANLELTLAPGRGLPVVRLLAYENHARMGRYAVANDSAVASGQPPNIVADDAPGRVKYGFGLNTEWPVADDGLTGAFLRAGWNDGHTESFAFTESEGALSVGWQESGRGWRRPLDVLAAAVLTNAIWSPHREYLALGGAGFLLGDGRLRYAPEVIVETYYLVQATSFVQISPDVQYITHPGYNRDRGPAFVSSIRVNLRY